MLVAGIGKIKNYKKKIEMSRIAYTTYENVLVELRSALRGDEFNKNELTIGQTPLAKRFAKK